MTLTTGRADRAALEMDGAGKMFGHVRALHDADLQLLSGEIHGIVGDNGAGKSTMLKILAGFYRPDVGRIKLSGNEVTFTSPVDARERGIATVYQDLALVECLDVATNLHLGDVPKGRWFVDRRRMERNAEKVLDDLDVRVGSVRTPVGRLSGGQRQIVAICRAIRIETGTIVLLDEPTAALGIQERRQVGTILRTLRARGKAVLIICHDLEFVFEYCDSVTVMRLGRTVGRRSIAETDRDEIIGLITGGLPGEAA